MPKTLMWIVCMVSTLSAQAPREVRRQPGFPPRFHDPSTPVKEGDRWYVFSTGMGIQTRTSKDLTSWEAGPPVFTRFPAWHRQVVPSQRGHLWAPEVITHGRIHRLYYSVSSFGKNTSAIGLASNRSLDPADPDYRWVDEGVVIQSESTDSFNAIDPHVMVDSEGRHWMSFGSFWSGIQLVELDPASGKIGGRNRKLRRIAWNQTIEAPAILKHGGYYYAFVNWGHCCRGVDSTYEIRMGRSKFITGPYLDALGEDMATGGGTLFLKSSGERIGPGHASFIDGGRRLFYHYYDRSRGGYAMLGSLPVIWNGDSWPAAGMP